MKKWFKSERGSMAVYATGLTLTFIIILMAIFTLTSSVRKNQLQTELKIKEVYEQELAASDLPEKPQEPEYVTNGLLAYYDGTKNTENGHSTTTTIWEDLSGHNNDGVLSRSLETNKFYWGDNCIILSNVGSTLQTYVNTPINFNGKERTISFTVDATNLTGAILADTNTDNSRGILCYQNFVANRGSSKSLQIRYDYTFNKGGIYNYTITLSSSEMKFYENGTLVNTMSNSIGLATANNLRLLADYYTDQNATNLKMYNFMAYDRVLTADEVKQNYNVLTENL